MNLKAETKIPCINLTENPRNLVQGSDGWINLSKTLREAAEEYGVFQVAYDKTHTDHLQKMFEASMELFDLPAETKYKWKASVPQHGYIGKSDFLPLFESMGIKKAASLEVAQAFTQLMWPDGNPAFCATLNSMSQKIHELGLILLKMLMDSYGLGKYYDSYAEKSDAAFKLMKYEAPHSENAVLGIPPHADRDTLTVIYQNSVQGIEIKLKNGIWIPVLVPSGAFVVFIGEALKAWSKGRVVAAEHKVMLSGDKTRYSFASFMIPKEGVEIESPIEFGSVGEKVEHKVYNLITRADYVNLFDQNEDDPSKKLESMVLILKDA